MHCFSELLLHPQTKTQLEYYVKKPSHAVLITGSYGSGKKTIAKALALELLDLNTVQDLESLPYFFHLKKPQNKQDISIDSVRELIGAQKLKTPGSAKIRSVVFIENAQDLSVPAQNSLLKILEEPKADTVFILTAHSILGVLPTIASRTEKLDIKPINLTMAQKFWEEQHPAKIIENSWLLSRGNVGLLSALIKSDQNHALRLAVNDAKDFLRLKNYEKLLFLDKLTKNKDQYISFLEALTRVLSVLHHAAIQKNNVKLANKLLGARKNVIIAQEALENNVAARLVNLRLLLNLNV